MESHWSLTIHQHVNCNHSFLGPLMEFTCLMCFCRVWSAPPLPGAAQPVSSPVVKLMSVLCVCSRQILLFKQLGDAVDMPDFTRLCCAVTGLSCDSSLCTNCAVVILGIFFLPSFSYGYPDSLSLEHWVAVPA